MLLVSFSMFCFSLALTENTKTCQMVNVRSHLGLVGFGVFFVLLFPTGHNHWDFCKKGLCSICVTLISQGFRTLIYERTLEVTSENRCLFLCSLPSRWCLTEGAPGSFCHLGMGSVAFHTSDFGKPRNRVSLSFLICRMDNGDH